MNTSNTFDHHPKDLVLDYYHCTFFLPLIDLSENFQVKDDDEFYYSSKDNPDLAEAEAQAYRYFSPTLRNILFDCKNSPDSMQAVKEWRLKKQTIESWKLHLGKESDCDNPSKYQRSDIVSVRLLQYFNGIYLLAVQVKPEALQQLRQLTTRDVFAQGYQTIDEFLQNDRENTIKYQQLIMEDWLHFTRHIRLLYPTFPQQNDENKIAPIHLIRNDQKTVTAFEKKINKIQIHQKPGHDFSPVICEFLKAFAKEPDKVKSILENYSNFHDDRIFVSVAYGIAGSKLPDKSLRRINTLVSHIDRQEEEGYSDMQGYAYTPEVILKKNQQNAFSLWEGLGGYYTYTDFSNTYLSNGWAFRTYIAPEHIPYIYDRMLIQALFYQSSLRYYDDQISAKTYKLLKQKDLKVIRDQREQFICFTNQYWFHHLTSQMQGKAIFKLQQNALELQQHYDVIKDELERTNEYLQTEHELKIRKFTDSLTRYGITLTFIAIYFSALPMIHGAMQSTSASLWLWTSHWLPCQFFHTEGVGLVILLLIIPLIMYALIGKVISEIRQKTDKD